MSLRRIFLPPFSCQLSDSEYAGMLSELQAEISQAVPTVDERQKAA
jgi:hypothetical protein